MSLVFSGPKRVYVLLIFWQRLVKPCAVCPRSLARIGVAMGADDAQKNRSPGAFFCRVVMAYRVSRILWRRLIGLSFFVLDPEPEGRR